MVVFIEHGISGHKTFLPPKEDEPNDIIGHTFLLLPQNDGHKLWVDIVTMIDYRGKKLTQDPYHIQFINSINDDHYATAVSYNNIANRIVQNLDKEILWGLKGITIHEEQLIVSHPNHRVYWCNFIVKWDLVETITNRLSVITLYYPFVFNLYTHDKNLFLTVNSTLVLISIVVTLN